MSRLPTIADVEAARQRLARHARRTPLLADTPLDALTDARILFKLETLQQTGSFKFRGAYNRLAQLEEAQRRRGVVAYSSGNHAQGVALAARLLDIPATIVMPRDAPRIKLANTRALGAEIVEYDRDRESREDLAARIARERQAVVVPAFDDPDIVAGQGTVGLEIAEQCVELGAVPDDVVVPCSGGGLVAGIALAVEARLPRTRVWAAEPDGFDDYRRSLAAGQRVRNERLSGSICDALMSPAPGEIPFEINRRRLAGSLVASDDEVRGAVAWAARRLKLVVEPGGAIGLACVQQARIPIQGRTVVVVLSGGNIDDGLLQSILADEPPGAGDAQPRAAT